MDKKYNHKIVIAHPDDEVIFLSQALAYRPYIICLTCGDNPIRANEFCSMLKATGCQGEILSFRDVHDGWNRHELLDIKLKLSSLLSPEDVVYTHNLQGEYGHPQHIATAEVVKSIVRNVISPRLGNIDNITLDYRLKLLENYPSQQHIIDLPEIRHWIYHSTIESALMSKMNFWNEAWDLNYQVCPCDVDFCDYLRDNNIRNKAIYHFGSGTHHVVGKRNIEDNLNNSILCITASPEEYKTYIELAIESPRIASKYKLMFGDIYQSEKILMPKFDVISLFHLNEFWSAQNADYGAMDDMAALYMFHELLADDGLILFYMRSNGYAQSQHLISKYIADREVTDKGMYKTLRVIQKGKHAPRAASVRQSRLSRRKV